LSPEPEAYFVYTVAVLRDPASAALGIGAGLEDELTVLAEPLSQNPRGVFRGPRLNLAPVAGRNAVDVPGYFLPPSGINGY